MTTMVEKVFFFYFLTHVPITILFDSQILFPKEYFHESLINITKSYSLTFKDSLFQHPPEWFQILVYLEFFVQFPFVLLAVYAFAKGGRTWIRTPSIMYGTHTATTLLPVIYHILTYKFPPYETFPGPETSNERVKLAAVYSIYFFFPLFLVIYMLANPNYGRTVEKKHKKN